VSSEQLYRLVIASLKGEAIQLLPFGLLRQARNEGRRKKPDTIIIILLNIKRIDMKYLFASLLAYLLIAALTGCKTKTIYVPVESVRTEYRDRLQRDSVHLYDSVFMKLNGDTIRLEKYKYIYRDRLRTDTVALSDTIAIPYPVVETREVKVYPRWLIVLACLGSLAAGVAGWRIYRKVSSFFKK
jgi:predicted small lipoprotein YifL